MNSNHQSSYTRNGASTESRYSKEQLLDLYRVQEKSDFPNGSLDEFFVDGWTPGLNGTSNGGWGKRDDHKDSNGPEICWDHSGSVQPLALADMTEEEKEVDYSIHSWLSNQLADLSLGIRFLRQFTTKTADPKYKGRHTK